MTTITKDDLTSSLSRSELIDFKALWPDGMELTDDNAIIWADHELPINALQNVVMSKCIACVRAGDRTMLDVSDTLRARWSAISQRRRAHLQDVERTHTRMWFDIVANAMSRMQESEKKT